MKSVLLFAAASLGLGGLVYLVHADDRPATMPSHVVMPDGIQQKDLHEQNDIYAGLSKLTDAAVKKGGFDDFVDRFISPDEDRMKKFSKEKFADLDGALDDFQKKWKAKYNEDFKIKPKDVYNDQFVLITEGEITNPALLSNWPVNPTADQGAQPEHATKNKVMPDGMKEKLNKGRNVAIATILASHGLPAVNVSMIHELPDSWKIDVPDNIDGAKIKENLQAHLFMMGQHYDKWPHDVSDGYRMVTHHIVLAVYDVNMPKAPTAKE